MDRGAWWATVHGVAESRTRLNDFTFTFHFHALEKEMAPHSSVLAGRIPGTGEPGGLPSVGSHRVGHDWSDLAAAVGGSKGVHFVPSWPLHYITYSFCCYCLCSEYTSKSASSIWKYQLRWLNSIVQNFYILTNYLCLLAVSVMERNLLKPATTFSFVRFCLMDFEVLVLDACIFTVIKSLFLDWPFYYYALSLFSQLHFLP